MISSDDECRLFGILRKPLSEDMVNIHGFPRSPLNAVLNWFNPEGEWYIERVEAWQRLLCAGAVATTDMLCPALLELRALRRNVYGSYDIFDADPYLLRDIHQIAKLVYKFHGTPRRVVDMESVKRRFRMPGILDLTDGEIRDLGNVLSDIVAPRWSDLEGRFGPGITCDGYDTWERWARRENLAGIPRSLMCCNARDPWCKSRHNADLHHTKIAEVPKNLKGNRIVSSEPAAHMFAQLALASHLDREIHRVFKGHVFLHDQAKHNTLLFEPGYCSIDLSDASDHISCDLVKRILPQLWPLLAKARSSTALFPDGEFVELSTFAPMGSGLCFVTMTAVILAACRYICTKHYHVYGDDIIVHYRDFDAVCNLLTRMGLVVNKQKSACNQLYRESCGLEIIGKCLDITPISIRDPLVVTPAEKIERMMAQAASNLLPSLGNEIASQSNAVQGRRWNLKYQRSELLLRTAVPAFRVRPLDGYEGLFRYFCLHTMQDGEEAMLKTGKVTTRMSARFKSEQDYPCLSHWLISRPVAKQSV